MSTLQKRYSLVDFFETWFQAVPSAIGPILVVALVALVPGSILMSLGMGPYFEWIGDMLSMGTRYYTNNPEEVLKMLMGLIPAFSYLMGGALVASLGFFYASLTFQWLLTARARGENPDIAATLKAVFPRMFFSGLLAGLLQFLLYMGAGVVGSIVLAIVAAILGFTLGTSGTAVMIGIVVVAYLGFIFLFVALNNLLTVVQPAVVDGDTGGAAISTSFKLVGKGFWRVLGIRIVISMAVGIASSVIFLIPSFILILPGILQAIPLLSDPELLVENPGIIMQAFSGFGIPMMILTFLSYVFQLVTEPVFNLFFYHDLKVRSGLAPDLSQPPAPASDETPPDETPPPQSEYL